MSESTLPTPLVPAEVNLQDFQYMELDVRVLRDSRFAAEVHGDAFRAGVLLWCAAWHQVPAGSLPDDDLELGNLAGYGRFVKEWRKVRLEALQGFIKCSDGRLYHEVIAAKALSAWASKLKHHYDRARDRLRKTNKARALEKLDPLPEFSFEQWNERRIAASIPMERAEASNGIPSPHTQGSAGIPAENVLKGNREGTEQRGNGTETSGSAPVGAGGKPPKSPADEEKSRLWAALKLSLVEQGTAKDAKAAGELLGKLASKYGQDVFLDAARATERARPGNAHTYLVELCETAAGKRQRLGGPMTDAAREAANARATSEAAAKLFGKQGEIIDA